MAYYVPGVLLDMIKLKTPKRNPVFGFWQLKWLVGKETGYKADVIYF